MSIEQQDKIIESSINLKEIAWVTQQIKEELKIFNKEGFYEKKGDKVFYNLNTVKQYLGALKDKKTWKELVTKNSSAMIMAVQIALYSLGYSFGNVDGILGDKTKEAIRKFQSDNNLPVDASGRSLPSTIQKLVELIGEKGEIVTEDGKTDGEINENLGNIEGNKMGDEKLEAINNQIDKEATKEDIDNKENEETLNQDVIRPEVQELIDSLNINGDRFQGLTYLTKSEAIAIATKSRGYFITLTGIKEIDEDVFEELLKYKGSIAIGIENLTVGLARKLVESGKGITFTGLEYIDQEVYEELGKTTGSLRFNALRSITEEGMGELVKKPGGEIYLNKVEEINEGIATQIVKYPRNIYLDGVKNITKEVAEIISTKDKGKISMKGLEAPLSEDVLDGLIKMKRECIDLNHEVWSQISKYKKQKEREGKDLSEIVLNVVDRKVPAQDLSKLTSITEDEIDILLESTPYILDLSGIKEINEEMFEKLLKYKGPIAIGIENLTVGLARKLVESGKGITFTGLEYIDQKVYEELGKTTGSLRFNALRSITEEGMGELVKKPGGEIHLNKVEEINEGIAEQIVKYPRNIYLDGVKSITREVAEIISTKDKGKISMKGLEAPLSEDVLDGLIKMKRECIDLNHEVWSQISKYKKQKETQN